LSRASKPGVEENFDPGNWRSLTGNLSHRHDEIVRADDEISRDERGVIAA
jgi:hypothetical protein